MKQTKYGEKRSAKTYMIHQKSKRHNYLRWTGGVVVLLVLLGGLISCTIQPTFESDYAQATAQEKTGAVEATATWTLPPNNPSTSVSTRTPVMTLTPVLEIGTSKIREKDGMEMVYVPPGAFLMGSTEEDIDAVMSTCPDCNPYWFEDEIPQHSVYLDGYRIDKHEVTNHQFSGFIGESGYETDAEKAGKSYVYLKGEGWQLINGADWQHPEGYGSSINDLMQYPVVHVSWNDAKAYCEWAGGRLPTEAEWEKAARGPNGRIYPWGDEFNSSYANVDDETKITPDTVYCSSKGCDGYEQTSPVGSFREGASIYGAVDMAGNVLEWTSSLYKDYPYDPDDGREEGSESGVRVLRGGSWLVPIGHSAYRNWDDPDFSFHAGFRCVYSETP